MKKKLIKFIFVFAVIFTTVFTNSGMVSANATQPSVEETVSEPSSEPQEETIQEKTEDDETDEVEETVGVQAESTEVTPLEKTKLSNIIQPFAAVSNVVVVSTGYTVNWQTSVPIGANQAILGYGLGLDKIYADGVLSTCYDPGMYVLQGGGYESDPDMQTATKNRLARLAVANNIDAMSNEEYAAFQLYQHTIVFAGEGFTITSTNVPNLQGYFTKFENQAANYWKAPTFNFGDGKIKSGETKTYSVTNGVTSGWAAYFASDNVSVTFANGVLTVVNNNISDNTIEIMLVKEIGSYKRLSMVYNKAGSQQITTFGISDPDAVDFTLTNLRYADIEISKKHQYTKEELVGVEGITFAIYEDEAQTIEVARADVDPDTGKAFFEHILMKPGMRLVEVSTNENFYLLEEPIILTANMINNGVITLDIENKPIPKIGTLASGLNGEKVFDPTIENTIFDKTRIEDLNDPTKTFTLITEAWIYDQSGEGNHTLYKSATYEDLTFETADETFTSEILAEANSIPDGARIFFVERIYETGKDNPETDEPVAEHNDSEDENQTIRFEKFEYTILANKTDSATGETIKNSKFKFKFDCYKDGVLLYTEEVNGDENTGVATFKFRGTDVYDEIQITEIEAPEGYFISKEVKVVNMKDFNANRIYSFVYNNDRMPAKSIKTEDTNNLVAFIELMSMSGLVILIALNKRRLAVK